MPVQLGLYTAIVMTAVGALFASSKQLINGPTNAISIAMLSALAAVPAEARIDAAIMMAMLIGIIQTGITLMRLGDLSRFISHAVIVGFTVGASVLLVLDQLKNVLGFKSQGSHHDHFLTRFYQTMTDGGPVHWPTVTVAIGTVLVAIVVRMIGKQFKLRLPELLIAIAAAGFATWWLDLGSAKWGVKLVDTCREFLGQTVGERVDSTLRCGVVDPLVGATDRSGLGSDVDDRSASSTQMGRHALHRLSCTHERTREIHRPGLLHVGHGQVLEGAVARRDAGVVYEAVDAAPLVIHGFEYTDRFRLHRHVGPDRKRAYLMVGQRSTDHSRRIGIRCVRYADVPSVFSGQ